MYQCIIYRYYVLLLNSQIGRYTELIKIESLRKNMFKRIYEINT